MRIERHCANTAAVAAWLGKRPEVTKVIHPSHADGRSRGGARRNISRAGRAAWSASSSRAARRRGASSSTRCKLLYHVANIGDARSLAIHPATTTHSQLVAEEQLATGVSESYVRLSIGIEHIDDILADLDQALKAAA